MSKSHVKFLIPVFCFSLIFTTGKCQDIKDQNTNNIETQEEITNDFDIKKENLTEEDLLFLSKFMLNKISVKDESKTVKVLKAIGKFTLRESLMLAIPQAFFLAITPLIEKHFMLFVFGKLSNKKISDLSSFWDYTKEACKGSFEIFKNSPEAIKDWYAPKDRKTGKRKYRSDAFIFPVPLAFVAYLLIRFTYWFGQLSERQPNFSVEMLTNIVKDWEKSKSLVPTEMQFTFESLHTEYQQNGKIKISAAKAQETMNKLLTSKVKDLKKKLKHKK